MAKAPAEMMKFVRSMKFTPTDDIITAMQKKHHVMNAA